jgi:uncharacterized membrane protein required for colicin V production
LPQTTIVPKEDKAVTITFFDVLIVLGLLGGAVLGFYRGVFRQAAMTLILYISTVVAALSYRSVSRTLIRITGQRPAATDVLGFFLVMAVMMLLLWLISRDLISNIEARRFGIWVNIAGMVFGFLNAAIVAAVVLIVLRSATAGEEWLGYQGVQAFTQRQLNRSWMVYMFRPFLQLILRLVEPWLFGHPMPPLLTNAL